MGAVSRSAMPSGKSLGPGLWVPHLVPIFSCHTWGPSRPRKPHRALHAISASGATGALLALWKWREESLPDLPHCPAVHRPGPHSPGHLSLLLLQGDPEVLGARGGQWVPRIPLHRVPQGSPKRGNGVRPPKRRPQPTHRGPARVPRRNSPAAHADPS